MEYTQTGFDWSGWKRRLGERRKKRGIRHLIGKKTREGGGKTSGSDAKVEMVRGMTYIHRVGEIKKWGNTISRIMLEM